jgi:hypoxanthine phosphoribosyltransferase
LAKTDDTLKLGSVFLSRHEIQGRVEEIASLIEGEYSGEELVIVGILKGAVVFVSDLARCIGKKVDVRIDFMAVSSYGDSTISSGTVKILKDMDTPAEGRNILLIDDIMDTGFTLTYLKDMLSARSPKSCRICALLEKPERREVDLEIEYIGFTIPNQFVVGYGLDYAGKWRNLPDIWRLTN